MTAQLNHWNFPKFRIFVATHFTSTFWKSYAPIDSYFSFATITVETFFDLRLDKLMCENKKSTKTITMYLLICMYVYTYIICMGWCIYVMVEYLVVTRCMCSKISPAAWNIRLILTKMEVQCGYKSNTGCLLVATNPPNCFLGDSAIYIDILYLGLFANRAPQKLILQRER
jgi:hypothetical protein